MLILLERYCTLFLIWNTSLPLLSKLREGWRDKQSLGSKIVNKNILLKIKSSLPDRFTRISSICEHLTPVIKQLSRLKIKFKHLHIRDSPFYEDSWMTIHFFWEKRETIYLSMRLKRVNTKFTSRYNRDWRSIGGRY